MAQYEHDLSGLWNPYLVGESGPSTYERWVPLMDQESLGDCSGFDGGPGQYPPPPSHGLHAGPATVYAERGLTNDRGSHSSLVPVVANPSSEIADESAARNQDWDPTFVRSPVDGCVTEAHKIPFMHQLRYEPSMMSSGAASAPAEMVSNVNNGPDLAWLPHPSHEWWNPQRHLPSTVGYTGCQTIAAPMYDGDVGVPAMTFTSHQPHEASVPQQSAGNIGYEQSAEYMIALRIVSGQEAVAQSTASSYQQEVPPEIPQATDSLSNNNYINEDVRATQPVVHGTHDRRNPASRGINNRAPAVLRVPVPRGCEKAVPEWEFVRFTVNRRPGILVSDVLDGTVTMDHAGRKDFKRWPYKTIHCCVSWPGYDWADYGDGNKFPVQDADKIFIRRDELAKRVCLKIQNFLFACSSKKPRSDHRGWSLSERSPNPIQLSDIWLISIHRTKCGGRWIPILELRR